MNQEQYMKVLKKKLRHLPKSDFVRAVEYFEEYFAEAGWENEQQAIADLGVPEEAADQIIRDIAIKNTQEPVKNMKNGLGAVWVGILAVFAAPIALPVLLMLGLVLVMLLFMVILVFVMLMVVGASVVFAGPFAIIGGVSIMTESVPDSLICFGYGLMGIGLGLMLAYGMYLACKWFLNGMIKSFGRMVRKGGKND